MTDYQDARAARLQALALLRIGPDFSPDRCVTFLEALKWRLLNELRGLHEADARNDHKELIAQVQEQINALHAQ